MPKFILRIVKLILNTDKSYINGAKIKIPPAGEGTPSK